MAVRAVAFDVFGTLVDWRSGVADGFRASGVSGDPYELADAWRARYRPILAEVNAGARPWGSFDDPHLVTLDDLPSEHRTAARLLGVQPAELMLAAAHPWDLEGARNAGLTTAFVHRPLEYGPGSEPREDPGADVAVDDLLELAARLAS